MQVNLELILQVIIAFFGAYFLAFSLGMAVWTFRDIRSRTRDIFTQILALFLVLVFNLPGLLLYFTLRPQETLTEAYQRSLEEEALLQDIEERQVCPGCNRKIEPDYIVCPSCHTELKRLCPHCNRLMRLYWDICPYCGKQVPKSLSGK